MDLPRNSRELFHLAERQGWVKKITGGGHAQWLSPDGKGIVTTSSTPSDWRSDRNLRSQFWQAGLRADSLVRTYIAPPPAKLIVDKNPARTTVEIPKEVKQAFPPKERGAVRDAIMLAMRALGQGSVEEVANLANVEKRRVGIYLADYVKRGLVERVGVGVYKLGTGKPPTPAPRPSRTAAVAPSVLSEEDFQVLNNALDALAAVETVIRKHMTIGQQFAGLRSILNTVKETEDGPR